MRNPRIPSWIDSNWWLTNEHIRFQSCSWPLMMEWYKYQSLTRHFIDQVTSQYFKNVLRTGLYRHHNNQSKLWISQTRKSSTCTQQTPIKQLPQDKKTITTRQADEIYSRRCALVVGCYVRNKEMMDVLHFGRSLGICSGSVARSGSTRHDWYRFEWGNLKHQERLLKSNEHGRNIRFRCFLVSISWFTSLTHEDGFLQCLSTSLATIWR